MGIYGHAFDITVEQLLLSEEDYLDSLPDISPDIINEMCICNLNEAEILLESAGGFNYALTICKRLAISSSMYSSLTNKAVKDIVTVVKTKGICKESRKQIRSIINTLWVDLGKALPDTADMIENNKFAGLEKDKVVKSIVLVFFSATVAGLALSIFMMIFGSVGKGLGATILGPLLEENCKQIAIKGGFVKEYTIVFNTFEFQQYITQITRMGGFLGTAVKVRLLVVGMHLTTTVIQWLTNNPEVLAKFNIKSEDDRNKAAIIGHTIGMIIHGVWNGLASFSDVFNKYVYKVIGGVQ